MIFLTVGTQFPFDRLVKAVDEAVAAGLIREKIFAQIGKASFKPRNMEYVEMLDKANFNEKINEATRLISHAGVGSIVMAMERRKPLLVMPRMKRYKEHVNDHQIGTARKFGELDHILVAYDVEDLPDGIRKLKNFIPKERKARPDAVANKIRRFLNSLQD